MRGSNCSNLREILVLVKQHATLRVQNEWRERVEWRVGMVRSEEWDESVTSRRRLLTGGAAATGAAYLAPQILRTAAAGAMTATVYVFKLALGGSCSAAGLVAGPSDPACDAAFNSALQAAASGSGNLVIGCPPAGIISSSLNVRSGDVSILGANCTLAFLGVSTTAGDCYPPGTVPGDAVLIDADEKGGCYVLDSSDSFDALIVAVRCVGSP